MSTAAECRACARTRFRYTIAEDISDRDLQKAEKQFGRCKSFDTYTPVGPFVYSDVDVSDLSIELWQNRELRQQARTSQMIYSVAQIVAFASQSVTLLRGDVILTGTPAGVGPIHAGDFEFLDCGHLRNRSLTRRLATIGRIDEISATQI